MRDFGDIKYFPGSAAAQFWGFKIIPRMIVRHFGKFGEEKMRIPRKYEHDD